MENKTGYESVISSRAQKEAAASWEWYEDRVQGLGDRFLKEILSRIKDIEKAPERFPTRFKSYKEASLETFPFLIIYRVSLRKKSIRIVSIFHTARNPKKKYG